MLQSAFCFASQQQHVAGLSLHVRAETENTSAYSYMPLPDSSLLYDHPTSPVSSSPLLPSITSSFFLSNLNSSFFSNPTLHRHLAPLRTDFTHIWTWACGFSFQLFSTSFSSSFIFLISAFYLSHNHQFQKFFYITVFSVSISLIQLRLKHF